MNSCSYTGKIYNMKNNGKTGKDANVNFRLAVPKPFVTDADKAAGKYNHFLTVNGWGPRAEQLGKFFNDGDYISVTAAWDPFDGQNGEVPQFRLNDWSFPVGVQKNSNGGGNSNDSSDRGNDRGSRDSGRGNREESSSRDSGSRRGSNTAVEDEAPPRRGSRRDSGNDGGAADNTPF